MPDLFGEEIILVGVLTARGKGYRGGYAMKPGSGPAGERCGTCEHDRRVQTTRAPRYYHKCALNLHWTHGPGSDIKMKTPACAKWEEKVNAKNLVALPKKL